MNVHPALRTLACLIGLAALSNLPAHAQDLRNGGKLLLTNGVSTIEGSGGGGLATWSTIAGNATQEGVGGSVHGTIIELPDYNWTSYGVSLGFFDRLELSYARQNLDTIDIGTALGLGRGYTLNQDVFGAKLKLAGDVVYGDPLMPQIAIGVQHKRSSDDAVVAAVGAASPHGTDFYISATKLFLSHSLLANATVRFTKANQAGLLGFGSATQNNHKPQFEGSIAYQFSRRFVVGGEYRTKPDNLAIAREDDWVDLFAAYALTRNVTVTAAYVDLGSIATAEKQRGAFLSLQAAF
ncbi:DUF3034 family protein [Blastomonas fulva]|uniref:DUF3034 family protein n=1 Tax=Blastomonas fulva TaxID=1550728 RepID=UPI0025A47902|nr:DUF3034 family protein [Blastomonas fulva]MDM7928147.1 DUF3034 family protein [Blastomonas fulva]MDM7965073.1 DUF3034 family protein [Blastomonas fulva]